MVLSSKGVATAKLGNYTQDTTILWQTTFMDPNDKTALNGKGFALYNLGNYTPYFLLWWRLSPILIQMIRLH